MEETQLAIFLVHEGLLALKPAVRDEEYFRLPLLLVGQGLERLLKILVATVGLQMTGSFPSWRSVRRFGHDVAALAKECVRLADETGYSRMSLQAGVDVEFLRLERAQELLEVMTAIAESARYRGLDVLLRRPDRVDVPDPIGKLRALRREFIDEEPELWHQFLIGHPRPFMRHVRTEYIAEIQAIARSVSRMLAWFTPLHDLGPLRVFAEVRDTREIPPRSYTTQMIG